MPDQLIMQKWGNLQPELSRAMYQLKLVESLEVGWIKEIADVENINTI